MTIRLSFSLVRCSKRLMPLLRISFAQSMAGTNKTNKLREPNRQMLLTGIPLTLMWRLCKRRLLSRQDTLKVTSCGRRGGLLVSALDPGASGPGSSPGDTVLCSWARQLTLTVPLSTQEYKWVPANCWGYLTSCRGVTCDGLGGIEILLAASCYGNRV